VRSSPGSRQAALALVATLAAGTATSAHRRDEYLQAARLAIDPGRVRIELDLTPGISIADAVLKDVDGDRDGSISAAEGTAYAARISNAVSLDIDGVALAPRIVESTFPEENAIRSGEGTIRLRMSADTPRLAAGAHRLRYRNTHQPGLSAYLANALVPTDARVAITAQDRDVDQRTLSVDYELAPNSAHAGGRRLSPITLATAAAMALLLALGAARRRGARRPASARPVS
jgi:hypothetical protein